MLDPKNCKPGEEQYEVFRSRVHNGKKMVQYDYRDKDGELFSTVKADLDTCQKARDEWKAKKEVKQ